MPPDRDYLRKRVLADAARIARIEQLTARAARGEPLFDTEDCCCLLLAVTPCRTADLVVRQIADVHGFCFTEYSGFGAIK